jgi:hypothetical protein
MVGSADCAFDVPIKVNPQKAIKQTNAAGNLLDECLVGGQESQKIAQPAWGEF